MCLEYEAFLVSGAKLHFVALHLIDSSTVMFQLINDPCNTAIREIFIHTAINNGDIDIILICTRLIRMINDCEIILSLIDQLYIVVVVVFSVFFLCRIEMKMCECFILLKAVCHRDAVTLSGLQERSV